MSSILYHRNVYGVNQWRAWYDENCILYTETGRTDGILTVSDGKVIKANKSKGKGHRTVEQQAEQELQALIKDKINNEWSDTYELALTRIHTPKREKPIWLTDKIKLVFPLAMQPKKDGIYYKMFVSSDVSIAEFVGLGLTRNDEPLWQFDDIQKQARKLCLEIIDLGYTDFTIEGELYSDTINMSRAAVFDIISGIANTDYLTDTDIEYIKQIKLHVFNLVIDKTDFIECYEILANIYEREHYSYLELIPITIVENEEEAMIVHESYVDEDDEGSIWRFLHGKRKVYKLKDKYDEEYLVIGYTHGNGKIRSVIWICITTDGQTFKLTPKGSTVVREQMYRDADNYVSRYITVSYTAKTKTGIPKFATTPYGGKADFRID